MPIINIPNVGPVTFPDGMSDLDITTAIEKDILPSLASNPPPLPKVSGPQFENSPEKAGLLAGTTLPADAPPMGNRMVSEVGTAPVPILKDLPKLDVSKMPVEKQGTFASDFGKLLAGSAIPSVIGAPEAVESAVVQQSKSMLPAPSEALSYLSSPDKLANKFVTSLGFKPIFGEETQGLLPEQLLKKQEMAIDEVRAKGKSQTLKDITEFGNKLGRDINATVSPEMQLAMANFVPTGSLSDLARGDIDKFSFGKDPSLQGFAGQFASVFGSVAPGMLGTIITKDPRYMQAFGFGQAGSEAVKNAREYIGSQSDEKLAKNSPYFKELIQSGYDPKTARAMVEEKAVDTASTAQGAVGMLGGDFTAKLITGKFDKMLLSSVKNRALNILARTSKGTVAGAAEEGIQEMVEGIASDLAIDKTVAKEIGADAFANLVLGAIGGAGPGGVRGAIAQEQVPEKDLKAFVEQIKKSMVATPQEPTEVDTEAPIVASEATIPEAPQEPIPATPVPPAITEQDTSALDQAKMLAELEDMQEAQAPQVEPAQPPVAPTTFENIKVNKPKGNVDSFISNIYGNTPTSPFNANQHAFVYDNGESGAFFELKPSTALPGAAEVYWFSSFPQRQGIGMKGMKDLQQQAAKEGISLTLMPWDKGTVSKTALTKFYKKAGFEPLQKGSTTLVWNPPKQAVKSESEILFPSISSDTISGLKVRDQVPNQDSIAAAFDDYNILDGIREVDIDSFQDSGKPKYYSVEEEKRTLKLAEDIKNNKEINPLIVAYDAQGPYILEGGHRFDALKELGIKSFPAIVVEDKSSDVAENIGPKYIVPSSAFGQDVERTPSFRAETKRLNKMFKKGRISSDIVANQLDQLLEDTKTTKKPKPLVRGAQHVIAKLNTAARNKEISTEGAQLATWFLSKNPSLAEGLAISIQKPGENTPSGNYLPSDRLVTLFKESPEDETAVHEILHHTERMMPQNVQNGIRKAWFKSFSSALTKAMNGSDKNLQEYFDNVLKMHFDNDQAAGKKAKALIGDGSVDISNYQYFNPSEFWAVNATDIVSGRFVGDKSFLGRLKQWLKEFAEKIKSIFGLDNTAPIIRALDSLSKADGNFKSGSMLSRGTKFENVKRTFKSKKTGFEVSPEKTPELYSWAMPEREDLILGTKKDDLMYQLLDKNIDTKQMQQAILKAGRQIDDNFNAYQKETLYHGKVAAKTGDFLKGDVLPLVKAMNKSGVTLEQLEEYLHMTHAEERNDKMNERNQGNANLQDRGSGIHTDEAKAYFKNLSKEEKAKLEPLAKQVYGIIDETQNILVRSGAEEKGLIDTWRKTYKKYVPLFREDDDFVTPPGTQMGSGFRVKGGTSKRATGSTKQVSNIVGNIIAQRERAIVREEKMKVGRALYGMAIKHPNPDFWYAFNPDAVKSKKAAKEELQKFGVKDVDAVMALIDAPRTPYVDEKTGQVGYRLSPITLQQHNAFPVRINGKDRYIFFNQNNPQALRMAKTLGEIDTDKLDMISNFVGQFTHWLAAVNTQYNPVFGAVNLIRDVKGAMYNLSTTELAGKQREVASKVMPSMKTIAKVLHAERNGINIDEAFKPGTKDHKDAMDFLQFRDDGGQTGYRDILMRQKEEQQLVDQELQKLNDPKIKQYARSFVNALSDFNDTMENSVRFAAYKTAIENGMSRDKAAYLAKELTVNFDRKGNLARRINAYFAFFNAAIRGSARIYETLTGPAGKKIMGGGIALGALQALMLAGYPDDDPPEFVRERNFILPIPGTKKMITIPYPLGYHVFPGLGRIASEFVFGDRKAGKAVTDSLSMFAEAFNPLGGGGLGWQTFAPTVLKIPAQVSSNKDSFGRPIYKEDRATQPTPGYSRSRDSASTISKYLAEALNYMSGGTKYTKGAISPTADEIDYYAGQVTGGVGRELAKTKSMITNLVTGEETPSYRIPLVGRFYSDVDTNAAKTQRFYNYVVEMSNHEQEIKGRQKNKESTSSYMKDHPEARLWQQANNIENQLSAIKKERKELKDRGASEEIIKRKNDQMIRLMDNFNKQVEKAKK